MIDYSIINRWYRTAPSVPTLWHHNYKVLLVTCHTIMIMIMIMIMIKVPGKGRACIPEGLIKA